MGVLSCPLWTILQVKVLKCVLRTSLWGSSGILKNVRENRFCYFSLVILYILSAVFRNIQRPFSLDVATNTVTTLYLHSHLLVEFIFSTWWKRSFFLWGLWYFLSCLENNPPEKCGLLQFSFSSGAFCYFVGHFRYIARILKWARGGKIAELHEWKILLCKSETIFLSPQGFRGKCCTVSSWGYLKRICYKVVQLWKSPGFSGVLWRGFLFVQLDFGADFTIGHLLLLEAVEEERCQTNVCLLIFINEILSDLAA